MSLEAALPLSLREKRPIESFGYIAKFDKRDVPVFTMFSGGLDSTYSLFRLQRLGFTNNHAVAVDAGETIDRTGLQNTPPISVLGLNVLTVASCLSKKVSCQLYALT